MKHIKYINENFQKINENLLFPLFKNEKSTGKTKMPAKIKGINIWGSFFIRNLKYKTQSEAPNKGAISRAEWYT